MAVIINELEVVIEESSAAPPPGPIGTRPVPQAAPPPQPIDIDSILARRVRMQARLSAD